MENSIGSVVSISKATDENLTTLCNRFKKGEYIWYRYSNYLNLNFGYF